MVEGLCVMFCYKPEFGRLNEERLELFCRGNRLGVLVQSPIGKSVHKFQLRRGNQKENLASHLSGCDIVLGAECNTEKSFIVAQV